MDAVPMGRPVVPAARACPAEDPDPSQRDKECQEWDAVADVAGGRPREATWGDPLTPTAAAEPVMRSMVTLPALRPGSSSAPAKKGHILTCQGADVSIGRKQREETALDLVTGLENRCCGDEPSSGVGHSASSGLHIAGPLDGEQAQGTSRSPRPDFRGRPA